MDPKFQTSFIPKQSLAEAPVYKRSVGVNLFLVLAFIIFFGVMASAVGVYLYEKSLNSSIATISAQLAQARSDLDPALVKELKRVDGRIQSAKSILNGHFAITSLLSMLGQNTLQNGISFDSFDYIADSSSVHVTIKGRALGFTSVALESEAISQNANFINPSISNVALDQFGNVTFTLTFSVNPAFIEYAKTLSVSEDAAQ